MAKAWNQKNPAVKRIMQEIRELEQEESTEFIAQAMEDDIFEFAFAVKGPPDTEFEGGIYHGRILLPAEYPFKPPSFVMLTPSGRFQTNVKICLSISSHHPEHWQPSWSVRTALTALIAFMPSPGAGALGSLDYTKEERQQLAAKSRANPPKVASAARQRVIDELHARMLELEAAAARAAAEGAGSSGSGGEAPADALKRLRAEVEAIHGAPSAPTTAAAGAAGPDSGGQGGDQSGAAGGAGAQLARSGSEASQPDAPAARVSDADQGVPVAGGARKAAAAAADAAAAAAPRGADDVVSAVSSRDAASGDQRLAAAAPQQAGMQRRRPQAAEAGLGDDGHLQHGAPAGGYRQHPVHAAAAAQQLRRQQQLQQAPGDRGLTLLAILLSVAIAMMLLKKIAAAFGGGSRVDALLHST